MGFIRYCRINCPRLYPAKSQDVKADIEMCVSLDSWWLSLSTPSLNLYFCYIRIDRQISTERLIFWVYLQTYTLIVNYIFICGYHRFFSCG